MGEWQGKKLDVQGSTQVICEPVIPEALKLRKWWNEVFNSVFKIFVTDNMNFRTLRTLIFNKKFLKPPIAPLTNFVPYHT